MVTCGKEYRKYMKDFITKVCDECGPRRAASEAERKAQDMIKEECETFSDKVLVDEFKCAYHPYPGGLVRVAAGLITVGIVLLVFNYAYLINIIVSSLALWVIVAELMVMLEFLDPLYKKDISRNVFGVIKPKGEVRCKVIFGGHSDSAYEMPFAKRFGVKISNLMFGAIGYGIAGMIVAIVQGVLDLLGFSLVVVAFPEALPVIRITLPVLLYLLASIVGYPFLLWVVANAASRKTQVLGANDNLSGVSVALALGKYFKENRPEHVEIWTGSFGAEEAGQRGSKAFVRKYGKEEGVLDDSYTIVLESLSGMGFGILAAEKMYLTWPGLKPVYHDKETVELFAAAVEKLREEEAPGMPYFRVHEATFAGTDATRFSQQGFRALALASGGSNLFIDNWHDRSDVPKNINKLMLWHAMNMSASFVKYVDEMIGKQGK